MPRKKEKASVEAPKQPVFETRSQRATVNFGDRTLEILVRDFDVQGKITLKNGETFYFSSALM